MNRAQKIARSFVITIPLGLAVGAIAVVMHYKEIGRPTALAALAAAVIAVGPFCTFFIFKKDKGKVTFDERDELIDKNAHLAGFGAVYLLVILVSYVPLAVAPEAKIPTQWFPYLFPIAVLCQCLAMPIATLIQYGRGGKDHE